MKVTNWRRKLATSLVACGMMSPTAALAANLDTNLVLNGTFESVDLGTTGVYNAPKVLQWSGTGFAYSHQPGTTGVPDYADGVDPPAAGSWYFSANNQPGAATGDVRTPDVVFQDIDVSTGATSTQIASGEAAIRLSAFFSSYLNDNDFGIVHAQFKNAGGATLSTAEINDTDNGSGNVWSKTTGVGPIPVGTASIRVSIFGGVRNGGTDGYIDNVDAQVTNAANVLLYAQVNTVTGQVSIRNQTGQAVSLDYYEITSASGALNRASWSSLQDQNASGFPAGNGTGNGWEEGGGGGNGGISESYLTGDSQMGGNATVSLGGAFAVGGTQDLVFRYGAVSNLVNSADFDIDSDVDGADFLAWQRGLGKLTGVTRADGDADGDPDGPPTPTDPSPLEADVDGDDLAIWKAAWQPRSTLVEGFVRYVGAAAASVPEPDAVILVSLALAPLVRRRR
jgi:hypothetical protein